MQYLKYFTTLLLYSAFLAVPAPVAADDGQQMLDAYKSFVEALEKAESFSDLLPYLPASFAERMKQAPPEALASYLQNMKTAPESSPKGDWVVSQVITRGDEGDLILRGANVGEEYREVLQARLDFFHDSDGWKLKSPKQANWTRVEMLPQPLEPPKEERPIGPGAVELERIPSLQDYTVVHEAGERDQPWDFDTVLHFDPRGNYVLATNKRQSEAFILDLETMTVPWSEHVYNAVRASLSYDGEEMAVIESYGDGVQVVPIRPHLDGNAPDEGYFFAAPPLPAVAEAVGGNHRLREIAYHPTRPLLAAAVSREGPEASEAIVFQPIEKSLWLGKNHGRASTWDTGREIFHLGWSPTGRSAAYVERAMPDGGATVFRDYPSGEIAHRFTVEGFTPGNVLFSPDGTRACINGFAEAGPVYHVINAENGELLTSIETGNFKPFGFTPDGQSVIGTGDVTDQPVIEKGEQDTIYTWKIGAEDREKWSEAFSPDERNLPRAVVGLGFSPNGRYLIAVGEDGEVRVWDALAP